MGTDFSFYDAASNYRIIDDVMYEVKKKFPHVEMFYSNAETYMKDVRKELEAKKKKISLTTHKGDFFPLRNEDVKFWNGFYSSRPHLKAFINFQESLAYMCNTLYSLYLMKDPDQTNLIEYGDKILQSLSISTHHDTITGTSARDVITDAL